MLLKMQVVLLMLCLCIGNQLVKAYTAKEIRDFADAFSAYLKGDKGFERTKRVEGGYDVTDDDMWPWLVSMRIKYTTTESYLLGLFKYEVEKSDHFCGASLINDEWLLTAAHCLDYHNMTIGGHFYSNTEDMIPLFHARLGDKDLTPSTFEKIQNYISELYQDYDLDEDEELKEFKHDMESWKEWEVPFEAIFNNKDYIPDNELLFPDDIALVKLAQKVPSGGNIVKRIQNVHLPKQTDDLSWPQDYQECVLKGWGCTEQGGDTSELAQGAILEKIPDNKCNELGVGTDTRVCVGNFLEGLMDFFNIIFGKGACPGDSGGPLMCKKDGEWVQAGVASFIVSQDFNRAMPSVFTRVTRYVDWIQNTMDEYENRS